MSTATMTAPANKQLRQRIVNFAQQHVQQCGGIIGGELRGYKLVQRIFHEVNGRPYGMIPLGHMVVDKLDEVIRRGAWIRREPTPPYGVAELSAHKEELGIAWCGIFTAWVYRSCGLESEWNSELGIKSPHVTRHMGAATLNGQPWQKSLDVGDVGVTGTNQHHVMIVGSFPNSDRVLTVEGNIPYPNRHAIELRMNRSKLDFHSGYILRA